VRAHDAGRKRGEGGRRCYTRRSWEPGKLPWEEQQEAWGSGVGVRLKREGAHEREDQERER